MATSKTLPKSIRFEDETAKKINTLAEIFDEPSVRVVHRAIDYLYKNKEAAVEAEAEARRKRIQDADNNTK